MSETVTAPAEEQQQQTHRPHETTVQGNEHLFNQMFNTNETVVQTQQAEQKPEPAATPAPAAEKKEDTPIVEEKKVEAQPTTPWIKEYGWETEDDAKAEISELKKLKETKPQELKYENEESRKVHQLLMEGKVDDVLDIYSKQKAIDKVASAEVNKDTAADIIKLNMQLKYPTLTKDQIDFQFRQEYGIPKEPVQKADELDEDFDERKQSWKEQVTNAEMRVTIAATMAKPELEAAKQKLVLPDIFKQSVQQNAPTQEDLAKQQLYDNAYLQSVDSSIKDFSGFSVTVKNEAVGLPETAISYGVADTEKATLAAIMKDFVNKGYDANSVFAERWVKDDKTLNTKLIAEDRYLLENKDKIFQKIANDAVNKTIEHYIKGKKNIDVSATSQNGSTVISDEKKTDMDTVRDQFFA